MQDTDEVARETKTRRLSGRIHVLGLGNVGTFVAHSIAGRQSPPPMTLLLHNTDLYKSWVEKRGCLAIQKHGLDDLKSGFDITVKGGDNIWYSLPNKEQYGAPGNAEQDTEWDKKATDEEIEATLAQSVENDSIIECLIVVVKAPQTVRALRSVRHRLTRDSTVLLLQNGMGAIDELNRRLFKHPDNRPHYMAGVISHGLAQKTPFQVAHTGVGTTILSPVPARDGAAMTSSDEADWAPTTKYLLRTLTLTPPLVAVAETPSSILLYQLEKLAMNAVINPLTSLMECRNGEILYNYKFTRIMRLLLIEISSVIRALPELQGIPGIETRFAPERLRWLVVQLANKTGNNVSSMLSDVLGGRQTEILYINGYIVRRGEELGIKCVVNYMMVQMVQAKQEMLQSRESGAIPLDLAEFEAED